MMYTAIRLIQDEHRSLSAVMWAAEYVTANALSSGKPPDFNLLRAMLYYLREFPERRHHRNEDRLLFRLIKERSHEADAVIAELEAQHDRGDEMLQVLANALDRWEEGGPGSDQQFSVVLAGFARFYRAHMEREETAVLPAAQRALTAEDWHEIHETFLAHDDPMFGDDTANDFRRLFSRIVQLVPAAVGAYEAKA